MTERRCVALRTRRASDEGKQPGTKGSRSTLGIRQKPLPVLNVGYVSADAEKPSSVEMP